MVTESEPVEMTQEDATAEVQEVGLEQEAPSEEVKAPSLKETPEFQQALKEAQSGWDRRIASLKADAQKAQAEARVAKAEYESAKMELQSLQEEQSEVVGKFLSDDPDAKQAFLDRRAIAEAKRQVARERAEVERLREEAELSKWAVRMAQTADRLSKETGIPIEDLEGCQTEEAMEVKALRFQLNKGERPKTPTPAPPKKVDSGTNSGKGGKLTSTDIENMDMDDYASHPTVQARYK